MERKLLLRWTILTVPCTIPVNAVRGKKNKTTIARSQYVPNAIPSAIMTVAKMETCYH